MDYFNFDKKDPITEETLNKLKGMHFTGEYNNDNTTIGEDYMIGDKVSYILLDVTLISENVNLQFLPIVERNKDIFLSNHEFVEMGGSFPIFKRK